MWVPRSFPAGPLSPPPPLASPPTANGAVPGQGRLLPPRGSLGMSWGAPSIRSPTLSPRRRLLSKVRLGPGGRRLGER